MSRRSNLPRGPWPETDIAVYSEPSAPNRVADARAAAVVGEMSRSAGARARPACGPREAPRDRRAGADRSRRAVRAAKTAITPPLCSCVRRAALVIEVSDVMASASRRMISPEDPVIQGGSKIQSKVMDRGMRASQAARRDPHDADDLARSPRPGGACRDEGQEAHAPHGPPVAHASSGMPAGGAVFHEGFPALRLDGGSRHRQFRNRQKKAVCYNPAKPNTRYSPT